MIDIYDISAERVREIAKERECSLMEAKQICIRSRVELAIYGAQSVDDLKEPLFYLLGVRK